jgi:hypothetical protein
VTWGSGHMWADHGRHVPERLPAPIDEWSRWEGYRPGLFPVTDNSARGFHWEQDINGGGRPVLPGWDGSRSIHATGDRVNVWPLVWTGVLLSGCWLTIGLVIGILLG